MVSKAVLTVSALLFGLGLTGTKVHAASGPSPRSLVGCWDNDRTEAAHQAVCFFEGGRVERREDGRFEDGRVAWLGAYRVSPDNALLVIWPPAQPARTSQCRLSFVTQRLRYFDKLAGSRVTADWPQLRLSGCDLAGEWLKACSRFQSSYGTCPRGSPTTD